MTCINLFNTIKCSVEMLDFCRINLLKTLKIASYAEYAIKKVGGNKL